MAIATFHVVYFYALYFYSLVVASRKKFRLHVMLVPVVVVVGVVVSVAV